MRVFTLVFVVLLFCISTVTAQSGWVLRPGNLKGDLVAVCFTSSDKGWVAGDNGYLASTTDGGQTWTPYPLNTTENINEIYFRNDENGYLVAGRKMFITRDAGKTWQDIRIGRTGEFGAGGRPEFLSIRFSDKKRGYVIGSVLKKSGDDEVVVDSLVMRTEDGGDTWRRITVPSKAELFHLDFDGNSRGWIVGDEGLILASKDEGNTWSKQESGTNQPLYNVDFRGGKEGWVVGKQGTILRTQNGGTSWEKISTNFTDSLMRVDFADDKIGWAVGYGGLILRSNDRGSTWVRQESNTRERLYGLYMDKKYGWAVGAKGTILGFTK
ncbi:MAG TPA: YCF48-related protein [Pyrinomonadaceae bacterium]|nr:YCF48-related protein [Pyrinomonadaceae bacterium]